MQYNHNEQHDYEDAATSYQSKSTQLDCNLAKKRVIISEREILYIIFMDFGASLIRG